MKLATFLLIGLLSFVAVPGVAQETGTTGTTYAETDDDGPDLGWLGLLGLAGLLGLRRREHVAHRDTRTATSTAR